MTCILKDLIDEKSLASSGAPLPGRIHIVRIKLHNADYCIINCYAPQSEASLVHERNKFWRALNEALRKLPFRCTPIMAGDMNAHVSARWSNNVMGKFRSAAKTNENGHRLIELCETHALTLVNTFFRDERSSWSWRQGDGSCTSRIDYLIIPRRSWHLLVAGGGIDKTLQLHDASKPVDHRPLSFCLKLPLLPTRLRVGRAPTPSWKFEGDWDRGSMVKAVRLYERVLAHPETEVRTEERALLSAVESFQSAATAALSCKLQGRDPNQKLEDLYAKMSKAAEGFFRKKKDARIRHWVTDPTLALLEERRVLTWYTRNIRTTVAIPAPVAALSLKRMGSPLQSFWGDERLNDHEYLKVAVWRYWSILHLERVAHKKAEESLRMDRIRKIEGHCDKAVEAAGRHDLKTLFAELKALTPNYKPGAQYLKDERGEVCLSQSAELEVRHRHMMRVFDGFDAGSALPPSNRELPGVPLGLPPP